MYAADNGAGYVVTAAAKGYGGDVPVMVAFDADGNIVTNGGRVLGITATGATLKEARAKAYEATEWVQFDNKYMRHDIGKAIDEA